MSTITAAPARFTLWRHSRRDAVPVALSVALGAVLVMVPSAATVALAVWWGSNTVAHLFLHRPYFRSRRLNLLFALYLTVLLGIPQSLWRARHLAHHAGRAWRPRYAHRLATETALVIGLWGLLLACRCHFFLSVYLPGYLAGLALCGLHGHYEHARGTISHHGWLYNFLFLNDGYHVEHHAHPRAHWSEIAAHRCGPDRVSRWPAVLRWLDAFSLDGLERWALRSRALQRFLVSCHERAFRRVLPRLPPSPTVAIVGGGLFPRTLLALRSVLPDARFVIIDQSGANLEAAQAWLLDGVACLHAPYEPGQLAGADLAVFPLAFIGDREAIYQRPPAPVVVVHDWLWRRSGAGIVVSLLLLKRLNVVGQ